MDKKLVTYIILSYNQRDYIIDTVRSVLEQNYTHLQVIVADDCSPDDTVDLIESTFDDPRLIVVKTQENARIVGNLNNALKYAEGEIIFLMGGDDLSFVDRTSECLKIFEQNSHIYALYTDTQDIDFSGQLIKKEVNTGKRYFSRNGEMTIERFISHDLGVLGCSAAYRRALFDHFGPLPEALPSEDKILTLRALCLGAVAFLPLPMVKYRLGTGVSNNTGIRNHLVYEKLYQGKLKSYTGYLSDIKLMALLSPVQQDTLQEYVNYYSIILSDNLPVWRLLHALLISPVAWKEKLRTLLFYFSK